MGAADFRHFIKDEDLVQGFCRLAEEAAYEHGHGGYTGTIAEKTTVLEVDARTLRVLPRGVHALPVSYREGQAAVAEMLFDHNHPAYEKWGPAHAVRIDDPEKGKGWIIFGWASS